MENLVSPETRVLGQTKFHLLELGCWQAQEHEKSGQLVPQEQKWDQQKDAGVL